jgi:two-component system OmpR family sensor kinase
VRRPSPPARLRWRLTGLTVLLLAAALLCVGAVQYVVLRGYVLERTYDAVAEQAAVAAKLSGNQFSGSPTVPGSATAVYDLDGSPLRAPDDPGGLKPGAAGQPWIEPGAGLVRSLGQPPGGWLKTARPAGVLDALLGVLRDGRWRVLPGPEGDVMVLVTPLLSGDLLVVERPLADVDLLLEADLVTFAVVASVVLLAAAGLTVWLGAAFDEMVDRLQDQIRRERESEARMRRFLADASHELRTPVSGILGHLEVLRRGALDSRADLEESLADMHGASVRMARLVGDLLTLTRFEQAEAGLRADPVHAGALVGEAARAARSSTCDHQVVLEPAPDGLWLTGDRDATERILVNLLDNAARHSPPGTRIDLAARLAADGRVELVVSDRGPGIPPGERERIFERLYRGDRSRASAAHLGAGLGLAICRALARGQRGDVTVRDAPGGGAVFVVTLPRAMV